MLPLTPVVTLCIISYVIYKFILYPAFISPLSKIPNAHPSSPFSSLWILIKRFTHQENRTIHAAHVKHGDIVRLGPNEISVNCVDDGIRTIYSGGFEKWPWYDQFDNFGVPCMFSTAESKPHSYRRRVIANVYSKSYLQSSPEMHKISQTIIFSRLLPVLESAVTNQEPVEVLGLSHAIAMDFVTAFMFGLQNGSNFTQDVSARRQFLIPYQRRRSYFWSGELPSLKSIVKNFIPVIEPKYVQEATSYIENWTLTLTKAAEKSSTTKLSDEENVATTAPIVYNQVHQSTLKNPFPYPQELQIATELQDHLAAGHETSGITLCYLFHELSLHPELQTQLRKEFLTLSPTLDFPPSTSPPELPSPQSLDALPILQACLMETLRIHAAIPGPEPRITPSKPTSLAGSPPLPPGVRVSSQPYTLHRRADVFPDPQAWKPERWLEASEEQRAEMGRWFWAFGSGGRMCIGSNFAMQGTIPSLDV
ncbi:MAG: hypothetical protein ALECFALPRED_004192 [Alectoria fallacina]|uniref:Cytochrome P450 n=1 Tax=Alectoria fallacina TaxID=1903189 RepID=A0A8H3I989_9LECA|nr:MAG: hypothetical protein ALECFALPRED_004192 [Alectoria fallacina]